MNQDVLDNKLARRERLMQTTREEIKNAAWIYLAEHGASALSLRAIASSIGFTAPALYRYFPSKNKLVTALILDAFDSLAEAQNAVLEKIPAPSWDQVLADLGRAYREWALRRPAAFFLIFGDPVPGYEAPWQETMPVAGRSLSALIAVLERARDAGALKLPLSPMPTPALTASLQAWSEAVHKTDPELLYLALVIGTRVQGLMLLELGRQLPPFFSDGKDLFEREIGRILLELKK